MRPEKTDYFYKIPETNCIPELLTDTQYKVLTGLGMIHNVRLRNYQIQRDYIRLLGSYGKHTVTNILLGMYDLKRNRLRKIYKQTHFKRRV